MRRAIQDHLVARPAVDGESDLVAHGAGGEVERGFLSEQLGDLVLETVHRRVLAELFVADLGGGEEAAHLGGGSRDRVAEEVDEDGSGHAGTG
jgi:hypothetical protein